ncbi:MAG: TonB-dependent receptor [Bacteroidia bacterium]|nr:TonB-dependent receptor [Bacteroidia bacterium]
MYNYLFAQTGSIKGIVYEKETGEPIGYCNVVLDGTPYGVSTDIDGYFNLTKIKPGQYSLKVTYIGYNDYTEQISITEGVTINKKIFLESKAQQLEEIKISGEREKQKSQIQTSTVIITPKEITKIPTIGSEPDFAQYLQVLPGIIFTGDQGGQLYIRGGPPIENKVLMDGMTIYNPFHSIGLFSVVDADIIRNADVYTGGFNAEYGGRISSIMDITMRDGNKNRLSGKLNASTFGSKILLEGPIKKFDANGKSAASFIVSCKNSYLKESSKFLYNYVDSLGLPFNFIDIYGKTSISSQNGNKLNLFGFRYIDKVRYQAVSDLQWDANGVGSNIILVPSGSPVLVKMDFAYSDYNISLVEDPFITGSEERIRNSYINGFNIGISLNYFIGSDELDYGIEVLGFNTRFNFNNSLRTLVQEENTTEFAGYLKYKYSYGKLLVEPGFRLQYYASLSDLSPEPRLGIKYLLSDRIRLKFGGGRYSQNLISANSDRDVVNLFYGFLSGPDNLQDEFVGRPVNHCYQTAYHAIAGTEIDVTNKINVNIEGYYKANTQLTNINRNKLFEDTENNAGKDDYYKKDFIVETGSAYGVDFLLKYDYKRIYVWFVYSFGFVNRFDGVYHYIPHFDRRHNINFISSYTFGKNLNWEASLRWNLGSGFPFTQTKGYYEILPVEQGINIDYTSINGLVSVTYAEVNEGRLPYYHRLDFNLKYSVSLSENSSLDILFSITNVYNRKNIFYFDRIKHERIDQLPILPSLGIGLSF